MEWRICTGLACAGCLGRLRAARKIRVDAFGGILWELRRTEQLVHLRQERYVRKRKLPPGLQEHPGVGVLYYWVPGLHHLLCL